MDFPELSLPSLITQKGTKIPLQAIAFDGCVDDITASISITQTYFNDDDEAIEAVYTFPLPQDAALLGLEAQIGNRSLIGKALQKSNAMTKYEETIASGDTAIMLEVNSGIYTANLGNIAPNEQVRLTVKFSILNRYDGHILKLKLPTVIGARFGDPKDTGLSLAAIPTNDLLVKYPCTVHLKVTGKPATYALESPTHELNIQNNTDEIIIDVPNALADRDFVLLMHAPSIPLINISHGLGPEGCVLCAAVTPPIPKTSEQKPRAIDILVDCSGSMHGTSIQQARTALELIINSLNSQDNFNIIAFGSNPYPLFEEGGRLADAEGKKAAKDFLKTMQADMGGTQTDWALRCAYKLAKGEPRTILLITDGDIHGSKALYNEAQNSECTIFPIGVGEAAADDILHQLAQVTNGKYTSCTPNENMATTILRHFERINMKGQIITVNWPGSPIWISAADKMVYAGDTEYFFACYTEPCQGHVTIPQYDTRCQLPQFTVTEQNQPSAIAAHACLARLPLIAESKRGAYAEQYNLLSPWTNFILTMEREDGQKQSPLPKIKSVPQMHAHNQFGMGAVGLFSNAVAAISFGPFNWMKQLQDKHCDTMSDSLLKKSLVEEDAGFTPNDELIFRIGRSSSLWEVLKLQELPEMLKTTLQRLKDKYGNDDAILLALLEIIRKKFTELKKDAACARNIETLQQKAQPLPQETHAMIANLLEKACEDLI